MSSSLFAESTEDVGIMLQFVDHAGGVFRIPCDIIVLTVWTKFTLHIMPGNLDEAREF